MATRKRSTESGKSGRVLKVVSIGASGDTQEWSKQLPEDPFGSAYKHSGIQEPPYPLEQLMILAEQHPTHSSILEQKAADIVGTGWTWESKDEQKQQRDDTQRDSLEEWFNGLADDASSDDTTHEILLSTWDDVETFGQGFIELARDPQGKLRYWFRTPAHTFRFHRDGLRIMQIRGNKRRWFKRWIPEDERVVDQATGQIFDNRKGTENPGNELLVLKRSSRRSTWYGIPKYISATGWITLSLAARDDNILFFNNRREPRWLIILENLEDDPELEDMIEKALTGDQLKDGHRNLVLPLTGPAKATFQKLSNDGNDLSWEKLQDRVDTALLMAHRMPGERIGFVRSGPLGGNAVSAATGVYKEAFVSTSQEILSARINRLIATESEIKNPQWTWKPKELDLTEEDALREGAVRAFQGGIVTLNEAREIAGEEALEDGDERGKKFLFEVAPQIAAAIARGQATEGAAQIRTGDAQQNADANANLANQIQQLLEQAPEKQ